MSMSRKRPNYGARAFGSGRLSSVERSYLKEAIVRAIIQTIRQGRLSRRDAAALIGVGQDKISNIFCRQLEGYSIERLLKFLVQLGIDIEICAYPKPDGGHGHVLFGHSLPSDPAEPQLTH
jgi:predicted XRE-type DNA-binding protein